ncbi:mif4g domain-containing protein ma3 domain-containing protein isoform 1 [Plasmopara halstedii]|uniref:Mif4g domain-containing protein ma3 domain-containing protein isoform 1 n=1 Tax=Plasmopara halstedii TaxID=4781 RepID=A0A0P1A4D2_PLAHL|nr:mif4g domain-containing protein ma3 domain-containing protein isoform 1 [Plasmopara halstedii]CEG35375.1 mif4g domain-containing protein ma3 domain-containing protein isoform 1 [Plasmopara halstedii]|eukprot:XP_024571744.1 mif4g domain-containing protein ma3 domain-containing protein isoform 1 [Plasmopara halstedii]
MARSRSRSRSRIGRHHSRRRARSSSTSSSGSSSLSRSRSRSRRASAPRKKLRRKSHVDKDDTMLLDRTRTRDAASDDVTPPRRSRDKKGDVTPPRGPLKQGDKKDLSDTKPVRKRTLLTDARASGRTGGVYIPPFKLAQLRKLEEKNLEPSSEETQRRTWDALRKSLNGLINKVNVANLSNILPELFQENLVRARGLLVRAIMKAQLASPGFTHIYAALVAVINTKMPEIGELLVKRVVYRFRRAFKRGDKVVAIALVRFIAHLVNQQVVHELLALEVLTLLLANPTDDSVEVAVNFTKESGQILAELCPEGLRAIFERFRGILHEGEIDKRVQYTIEGLFAIRKGGFADYPAVHEQLDLVETGDQITHETTLEENIDCEDKLDVFRFDPDYEKNEQMWAAIKKEILGESDSDSKSSSDYTEQDLVNLRRTIYLTIMSSITHEECAHKLMKLNIRPGQEKEICLMLIECCSQERTYLRYYGLLSERFCLIKREYQDAFDECFAEQYSLIHRLETNKLRNVAKLFAHLLFTDALPWTVFEYIHLNEEETTSSSRIFIKILCQELSEHLGLKTLKERFFDEIMQPTFAGLFPRDNPRNTRFAINFFTSIGLGGLTTGLREYLKIAPKMIMEQQMAAAGSSDSESDSDLSDSTSSSSMTVVATRRSPINTIT